MSLIVAALVCMIATAAGVGLFARWARRGRLMDLPNPRSSHQVPTPRGAGAVIVAVVAAAMTWASSAGLFSPGPTVLAALAVALVSAIDDVRSLPSGLRLIVHTVCALVAVLDVAASTGVAWSLPLFVLAIMWVVGLTNAYNFMDGIDGISGVQAMVAGFTVMVASLYAGQPGLAVAGTAIASASAGFLLHNWSPARVFIGDVGSAFLGYSFAVLSLAIGVVSPAAGAAVALSLWPYIFDTTLTFARRALRRENVLASHRSHLYQRLVIAGWSHARVALVYGGLAAAGAAASLTWALGLSGWQILLAVPFMAIATYSGVVWSEAAARDASSKQGDAGAPVR